MRSILLASLLLALAFLAPAHANPALHGTWSAAAGGQPLTVTFDAGGAGKVNGKSMRWQTMGGLLLLERKGDVASYSYELKNGRLSVAGGDLAGTVVLTRGTTAADAARASQKAAPAQGKEARAASGGNGQELVGKWCLMSNFRANTGGSSRMTCFDLRPDGTYTYRHEGSSSGAYGGTASQSSDAGRWKVSGNRLTAQSQRGTTSTYTLEKRNHPKNKRDPMICLDGQCYVTAYNKPAW